TWAALDNREVAASCTLCHTNTAKCDTCHTRHTFSTVGARKPQACATCHNGVDHDEYEQYMYSKHGTQYQTLGQDWNWNARLADALDEGNYTAPTCQLCQFEYKGKFSHNVTQKVRWGFLPTPDIANNLDDPWFEKRKLAWQATCSMCHSPRFAKTYLDFMDKGIKQGTARVEQTRKWCRSSMMTACWWARRPTVRRHRNRSRTAQAASTRFSSPTATTRPRSTSALPVCGSST